MKSLFLLLILFSISIAGFSKTLNLDSYLKTYYDNAEYKKCYDLTRVIAKGNYSGYSLTPFGIKFNDNITYVSSEMKYYELHSLYIINPNAFYYNYITQNDAVLKYFSKEDIYPKFLNWVDSLYNSPIVDDMKILVDNALSNNPIRVDKITEIKNDVFQTVKLNDAYKYLSVDTISRDKIFKVDNSDLVKFMNKYKNVDLLNLHSEDFDLMSSTFTPSGKTMAIQNDAYYFFKNLFKIKRFVNEKQIYDYLYTNTNFTNAEKIFVTYYFFKAFLSYALKSNTTYSEYSNIEKIIVFRATVCNGYSVILKHFLNRNNIECYHITLNTKIGSHANNILVYNNKVYYVDITWGIYFKDINTLKDKANIKTLSYIQDIDNKTDYNKITYLKNVIKKGS